jgi:hypothetical protein
MRLRRVSSSLACAAALVSVLAARLAADEGAAPAAPPAAKRPPHVTPAPFGCAWEGLDAARAASAKDGRPVILYFTFDG